MNPILFEYKNIVLPAWHFCYFLAALVALVLLLRLVHVHGGVSRRAAIDVYMLCYVAGYFGARALSIIVESEVRGLGDFFQQLVAMGGMTLYGGVVAAASVALLYLWRHAGIGWYLLDYVVIVFLLALAIGRVGCFLNGDDFGVATDSVFGVVFPNLGDNIKRHPTQLYETAFCLMMFICLYRYCRALQQRFFIGAVGIIGAGSYALFRFGNEFLRGDYRGWVINDHLSTSQFISIVLLATVCICWRWRRCRA